MSDPRRQRTRALAADAVHPGDAVGRSTSRRPVDGVELRRYGVADHASVLVLHRLALQDVGADAGPGPWDDDLDAIESVYLDGLGEFLVGVAGGRIVAMGALLRRSKLVAEIKRMRVHPDPHVAASVD